MREEENRYNEELFPSLLFPFLPSPPLPSPPSTRRRDPLFAYLDAEAEWGVKITRTFRPFLSLFFLSSLPSPYFLLRTVERLRSEDYARRKNWKSEADFFPFPFLTIPRKAHKRRDALVDGRIALPFPSPPLPSLLLFFFSFFSFPCRSSKLQHLSAFLAVLAGARVGRIELSRN